MDYYRVVRDSFGDYRLVPMGDGSAMGCMFLIGLSVIVGALMAFFMDAVYERGEPITLAFIITSVMLLLVQIISKSTEKGFWKIIHMYIVSPLFILYLYTGLTYWTPWIDNFHAKMNDGNMWYALILFIYIFGSPIFALLFAPLFTVIITLISNLIIRLPVREV